MKNNEKQKKNKSADVIWCGFDAISLCVPSGGSLPLFRPVQLKFSGELFNNSPTAIYQTKLQKILLKYYFL